MLDTRTNCFIWECENERKEGQLVCSEKCLTRLTELKQMFDDGKWDEIKAQYKLPNIVFAYYSRAFTNWDRKAEYEEKGTA